MSMNNSNDTIGNRIRDLPVCSAVPQPTAPDAYPLDHIRQNVKYHSGWFLGLSVKLSFFGTGPLAKRLLPGVSEATRWSHMQVPNVHTVPEHRTPIIHTTVFQKSPPPKKKFYTHLSFPPSTAQPPPLTHTHIFNLLTKWFKRQRHDS